MMKNQVRKLVANTGRPSTFCVARIRRLIGGPASSLAFAGVGALSKLRSFV